jgi:hypothetical protein
VETRAFFKPPKTPEGGLFKVGNKKASSFFVQRENKKVWKVQKVQFVQVGCFYVETEGFIILVKKMVK